MSARLAVPLFAVALCVAAQRLIAQASPQAEPAADAAALPPPALYGRIDGDLYASPIGAFRIRVPVLPELGGTVSDTANVVTFDDDFSTHCSVGAFPLSPELKAALDARGLQGFLTYFFTDLVMPDYTARYPGATIEDVGAFLPEFQGGAMLVFTLLPGGSPFEHRVEIWPSTKPVVAKRGNLCFLRDNFVFVISIELPERALERSTYALTTAEENVILRRRLVALVNRMEFPQWSEAPR